MAGTLFLTLFVVVGLATLAVVVFLLRRGPSGEDDTTALRVIRTGSLIYGALVAVATAVALAGTLFSDVVQVSVPTYPFWPTLPDGVAVDFEGDASIAGGGFTKAELSLAGLSLGARAMLAAGGLIQGLVHLAVTVSVYLLARRLLQGDPFRPVLSRTVNGAAVALAVGGVLWQVFLGIGESMAAREALEIVGWTYDESLGIDDPASLLPRPTIFSVFVDFWPILTGIALAAVAAAFRYAERLQRDTVGLV